ncbi:MAG: tyrosine-type recombinase/integrase [Bacilli bacterium]
MKTKLYIYFYDLTSEFLNIYLPGDLGRSINTIESYRDSLTVFRKFIKKDLNLSISQFRFVDCDYDCLTKFKKYLREKGNSPTTINCRLAAIKSFMVFASDKDSSLQSYALRISHVKFCNVPKKATPQITESGMKALLLQPNSSLKGIRNSTIMIMLFATATRLDELLSLTLENVFLKEKKGEQSFIKVVGKGNKERIIGLSEKCIPNLKQYMSFFHSENPQPEDLLFYTVIHNIRNKMAENTVERFVKQYADKARKEGADIPENFYPHQFRAYKATIMYQEGTPLEVVSSFLGHSHVQTTLVYAKISQDTLNKAINSIQPEIPLSKKKLWLSHEEELARKSGIR